MASDPPVDQSSRPSRSWLLHPVGTVAAAVICAAFFLLAVTSGDAPADDDGNVDTNGITPDAKPKFGYPFCRVNVSDLGDLGDLGPGRYHVAVTLLNDLPQVWAVLDVDGGQTTVPIALVNGMGQAVLPAGVVPSVVTIYGTEQLLGLSAGCAWPAG